jgi:hypothetical protein
MKKGRMGRDIFKPATKKEVEKRTTNIISILWVPFEKSLREKYNGSFPFPYLTQEERTEELDTPYIDLIIGDNDSLYFFLEEGSIIAMSRNDEDTWGFETVEEALDFTDDYVEEKLNIDRKEN